MIVGFVDIGSNAARLLVADVGPGRRWRALEWAREPLRLGRWQSGGVSTQPAEAQRLLLVARGFVERCQRLGTADVVAVATAALRQAPDRDELLRRLWREAGLRVRLLEGEEEARLVYLGLAGSGLAAGRRALVLDIGGGSTEVAIGEGARVLLAASLPVGAVRLADAAGADAEGRVSDGSWRALCERVKQAAAVVAPQVRRLGPEEAFGVAGTIRSLASLAGGEHPGFSMTRAEALRLATRLRRMTVRERRDDAGLYPDRADVIVPGVAVLVALMEIFDLSAVRYAAAGVREGLVQEYLGRLAS